MASYKAIYEKKEGWSRYNTQGRHGETKKANLYL